jgi:DNA-binding NtrC family response regulator
MKEKFDDLVDHLVGGGFFLEEAVELLERKLITRALERTAGNRCAASKLLGIHRNTLQRKLAEYEMDDPKPSRKPVRRQAGTSGRNARSATA